MSDSESTIKFAIFDGITSNWHKQTDPNFAKILRDEIFAKIFEPHIKWAVDEYLQELSDDRTI